MTTGRMSRELANAGKSFFEKTIQPLVLLVGRHMNLHSTDAFRFLTIDYIPVDG